MKRKFASREASRIVLKLAEGLFAHTVDFGLWVTIYFAEMSLPQSPSGQLWRAQIAADRFLNQVNYDVIKNAIQTARKRGWVKFAKRRAIPEITAEGKRRLAEILPHYDEKRIWDGRMHIITYDIPEDHKREREMLRRFLQKIRCGRLQDSVWITPYNPVDLVRSFTQEHGLHGTIIVSDMGKDGSIGEDDLKALVVRVFALEQLNDRYEDLITRVEESDKVDHAHLLSFFSILDDDPQLPFSLLPHWWKGNTAYQKVKAVIKKVVNP